MIPEVTVETEQSHEEPVEAEENQEEPVETDHSQQEPVKVEHRQQESVKVDQSRQVTVEPDVVEVSVSTVDSSQYELPPIAANYTLNDNELAVYVTKLTGTLNGCDQLRASARVQ